MVLWWRVRVGFTCTARKVAALSITNDALVGCVLPIASQGCTAYQF